MRHVNEFSIEKMCTIFEISESRFYAWRKNLRRAIDEFTGNQSFEAPNLQSHDRFQPLVFHCAGPRQTRFQSHRAQPNLGQRFDLYPSRTPLDVFDHRNGLVGP